MKKIRTNHLKVNFRWDQFLEDIDLFKIEYGNAYDFENTSGIYCRLEGLCANNAICAFDKNAKEAQSGEPKKHRIFLFASAKKENILNSATLFL